MVDHLRLAIPYSESREPTTATVGRDPGARDRPGSNRRRQPRPSRTVHQWSLLACSVVRTRVAVAVGHRASPRGSCRSWATTAAANVSTEPSSSSRAARALAPQSRPVAVDEDRVLRHVASWHRCGFDTYCRNGYVCGSRATPAAKQLARESCP